MNHIVKYDHNDKKQFLLVLCTHRRLFARNFDIYISLFDLAKIFFYLKYYLTFIDLSSATYLSSRKHRIYLEQHFLEIVEEFEVLVVPFINTCQHVVLGVLK